MIIFIAGTDTGVGKTMATGLMARWYASKGCTVITHKMVQTGCAGISHDIITHRQLMGVDMLPEDRNGLTCPFVFRFPGSPHLAAAIERKEVDPSHIASTVDELALRFDVVLVEGVGGLCVPLTKSITALDLISAQKWPVVLVSGPRLGSINHTFLSLEALHTRRICLLALIYNLHLPAAAEIVDDSRRVFAARLKDIFAETPVIDIPGRVSVQSPNVDFAGLPVTGTIASGGDGAGFPQQTARQHGT